MYNDYIGAIQGLYIGATCDIGTPDCIKGV